MVICHSYVKLPEGKPPCTLAHWNCSEAPGLSPAANRLVRTLGALAPRHWDRGPARGSGDELRNLDTISNPGSKPTKLGTITMMIGYLWNPMDTWTRTYSFDIVWYVLMLVSPLRNHLIESTGTVGFQQQKIVFFAWQSWNQQLITGKQPHKLWI
jgi:hypothetical protein